MWGVGFSLALAALLQGELGIDCERGAGENRVSQASDPPFARDETLPTTTVNWTSDAPETGPPACRGKEDCPPWSSCEEDHVGRQICHCGLGYHPPPCVWLHASQSLPCPADSLQPGAPGVVVLAGCLPDPALVPVHPGPFGGVPGLPGSCAEVTV
ncbi:uncharacterized protein LOC116520820 isoform X4 [Thamnophis elegans]|uniref:uncharacterized protein LOC116520820 isoform X4 n=1 Tax=Thamnophis elegans TaxID=35005 RepID=UPI0013777AA8|nr:uncharacterized protein LOC116520820 isoform X4 [Thamnophis elegans]